MSILSFYSVLQLNKEWVPDHVHHLSLHLFPIYKFYAVWQSAIFISKGCTIVLPSHTYGIYEWSTPLDFHILRYWFSDAMCIKPKHVLMFLSKWKRLQKCRPPAAAAAAEQEIFQCLKNTINRSSVSPFASIWCYQLTFWHIFHSRIFFFNIWKSLLDLESLQGRVIHIYQTHCA